MASSPQLAHPRYDIESILGSGGIGFVYQVLDRATGQRVALKTVRPERPEDQAILEHEIRVLARLGHSGIVRLLDLGRTEDGLFYTMEILGGTPLDRLLATPPRDRIEIGALVALACEVTDALAAVHDAGICHGDLKPANILALDVPAESARPWTTLAANGTRIKIVDFGLARVRAFATHGGSSVPGSAIPGDEIDRSAGTPLYMAPEQLRSERIDARADLYSLGALFYHLLTGRPPFASLEASVRRDPSPPRAETLVPELPAPLGALLERLLSERREDRPEDARQVLASLRALEDPGAPSNRASPRARLVAPRFVGRERELDALASAVEDARRSGRGRVLHLRGDRGSGRTALLRSNELKTRVTLDHGGLLLYGAFGPDVGDASGLGAVFRDATALCRVERDPVVATADPRDALARRRRFLSTIGLVSPGNAPLPDERSAPLEREILLTAAQEILVELSTDRPVLLVLDDFEHADELARALVERLAGSIAHTPLVLVLTRASEVAREPPSPELGDEILLDALSDRELEELIASSLEPPGEIDPGLLEHVAATSRGIPLAARARVHELWREATLSREDGAWRLEPSLPTDEDAAARATPGLDGLAPDERRVLAAAAVLETHAPLWLLEALVPLEDLETVARSLAERGLLESSDDGYRLATGLDPAPLRAAPGDPEQAALHRAAAAALTEHHARGVSGPWARIGEHLAQSGERERAAELFLREARDAERRFANTRALASFERAVELADSLALRGLALRELGTHLVRRGEFSPALERFEAADRIEAERERELSSEEHHLPRAARQDLCDRIGRVHYKQRDLERAESCFRRLLESAGTDRSLQALAHYRLGSIAFDRGDVERASDAYTRSLELYGAEGPLERLLVVYLGLALVEKARRRIPDAIRWLERALEAARASGQWIDVARIEGNLGNLYRAQGDTDRARASLESSIRARRLCGDRHGLAICLNNLARIHVHEGELEIARDRTEAALRTFESIGDARGVLICRCNLGEILVWLGHPRRARELLAESLERSDGGSSPLADELRCNLARAHIECGEPAAALATLGLILDSERAATSSIVEQAASLAAECSLATGRKDEAGSWLERCPASRLENGSRGDEKSAELVASRVAWLRCTGRAEEACELGRLGLEQLARESERVGIARLERELGASYRELGPDWADRTERHLQSARDRFATLHAPVEEARSHLELAVYWSLLGEEEIAAETFESAMSLVATEELEAARDALRLSWEKRP